jgi:uncharacterized protein YdhG (YjbR/CyaY superfamily)
MKEVESLLAELAGDEKIIVSGVRNLILESDPRIGEKLSYGVPYFFHHRAICFLWPISKQPKNYPPPAPEREKVIFGFCYGNLLSNDQGLLQLENRKQVSIIKLYSPKDIQEQKFREIIQEAIIIDDQFAKRKKTKHHV